MRRRQVRAQARRRHSGGLGCSDPVGVRLMALTGWDADSLAGSLKRQPVAEASARESLKRQPGEAE